MWVSRTTCKASIRWIAKAASSALAVLLAAGLAACEPKGELAGNSCVQMREKFDKSFSDAVGAAVRKAFDEKRKYLREGQEIYVAMERKGCCANANVCPPMNVH